MKLTLLVLCALPLLAVVLAAGGASAAAARLSIASPAFPAGAPSPRSTPARGPTSPPELTLAAALPAGTKSLALVVDDPDAPDPAAPKMTWVHWVLYDLPPSAKGLPEGVKALPTGTREGKNDWKRTGWGGPCPPIGTHRYFFKLYALDVVLPRPRIADEGGAREGDGRARPGEGGGDRDVPEGGAVRPTGPKPGPGIRRVHFAQQGGAMRSKSVLVIPFLTLSLVASAAGPSAPAASPALEAGRPRHVRPVREAVRGLLPVRRRRLAEGEPRPGRQVPLGLVRGAGRPQPRRPEVDPRGDLREGRLAEGEREAEGRRLLRRRHGRGRHREGRDEAARAVAREDRRREVDRRPAEARRRAARPAPDGRLRLLRRARTRRRRPATSRCSARAASASPTGTTT